MATVADQMVETLAAARVKHIYGLREISLNGFTDALRRRGGIHWLHVRHKEAAVFAAVRTRMSPAASLSVSEAAAPGTCTSSTVSSTATARACRSWRSLLKFPCERGNYGGWRRCRHALIRLQQRWCGAGVSRLSRMATMERVERGVANLFPITLCPMFE
jgi:Thiamine pyrophosphate enzyme, N-terminal TPP binding domain